MDNITASEIAGLAVGALLLSATIAAPKIDAFISSSQRRSLGMCKRCGNVRMIACSGCKGTGFVNSSGFFGLSFMDNLNTDDGLSRKNFISCTTCGAKGHFSCPDCSKD